MITSWTLTPAMSQIIALKKTDTYMLGDKEKYLTLVRRKSLSKLREIALAEIKIKRTELVGCIRYLLNHRNHSNDDTIKYHLDPRRLKPG
jgi:hypothetical protein